VASVGDLILLRRQGGHEETRRQEMLPLFAQVILMEEKSLIRKSVTYPFLFVATLWIIKFLEAYFKWNLFDLGIRPRIPRD